MISITIPAHNENPAYFRECLSSVRNQTYKGGTEIIVVDDGSTNRDETEKIAGEFGARYLWQENVGIGAARAKGVELASGDYIVTLASHDLLLPNYFEEMLRASGENPGAVLFSDYVVIDADGKQRGVFRAPRFDSEIDFRIAVVEQAKRNTMFVNFSTTFGPAKIWKAIPFRGEFRYGEDLCWLLEAIFVHGVKFVLVPIPLIKYRAFQGNVTSLRWQSIPENNRRIFRLINGLTKKQIFDVRGQYFENRPS